MPDAAWTPDELITVTAARRLAGTRSCFAGIGLPSAAAILAIHVHVPDLYLVFESGILGPQPGRLPLSVADPELARTAQTIVGVAEMFAYWLQPGRIEVGALGAAQVDRRGNINSTVIGPYESPRVRLPGAGGAPEIASACRATIVLVRHGPRTLVERLDFVTTVGHGNGPGDRAALGFPGGGPSAVITDLAVLEPAADGELELVALQPRATVEQVVRATGWPLRVAADVGHLAEPTYPELEVLRSLAARPAKTAAPG
jgi:glutaconate CoA-transferase subunit B